MNTFDGVLTGRLEDLKAAGLYRELQRVDSPQSVRVQIGGRDMLNFSSNDYLGFANHPKLKDAAVDAVNRFGAGSGASRLVCGSLSPHEELEAALADFKGTGAALSFSSGYATALGTICALLSKNDIIVLDKLVHASIVDAARLSGAKIRVFPHNDLNALEKILKWAEHQSGSNGGKKPVTLVVVESVYSMDGDQAPLKEIVNLKNLHGAWLMVDEAHAAGLLGEHSRGLAEELGVSEQVEVQMGTLGKALGAAGGFVAGSRVLVDYLVNRARSFIFSTAPPPAVAAAASAALRLLQTQVGVERKQQLWKNVERVRAALGLTGAPTSAIIPIHTGDEAKALHTAAALRERGILLPAIRYPTVARGKARLRLTLTAEHDEAAVKQLVDGLNAALSLPDKTQVCRLPYGS